jgi:hypothetical protein
MGSKVFDFRRGKVKPLFLSGQFADAADFTFLSPFLPC